MVLDTFDYKTLLFNPDKNKDMLIFKNTFDDPKNGQPKQFKISRTDPNAPEELYFVHIEVKDMNSLPYQDERKAIKEASIALKRVQKR